MLEWVPTYESLYDAEKLGLRHTARSVYTGLCIKARKDLGDRVRLPRGMALVDGVVQLVGGDRDEVESALQNDPKGLLYPRDPMISVEGEEGALVIVVLRRDRWALDGDRDVASGAPEPALAVPTDAKTRRRIADAERKRNARRGAKGAAFADGTADASAAGCGQPADAGADSLRTRPQDECGRAADAGGVRGGVSDLQTQIRKEEKTEDESVSARADECGRDADGHADTAADASAADARTQAGRVRPPCSEADLAALLRELEVLAVLADDPDALQEVYTGFVWACGDTATVELARVALGKMLARERCQTMAPGALRKTVGTYLGNARRYDRPERPAERGSEPGATHPDAPIVLDVFEEVWSAKKGREYVRSLSDERKAVELVAGAREAAKRLGIQPRDVIRHRVGEYLRDADPFVADKDHPFALFVVRINQYGLPKPPRERSPEPATVALARAEPPSAAETIAASQRATKALRGLGTAPRRLGGSS